MFRKINIHVAGIAALLSLGLLASCGSGGTGSNNQGASFLAYGYFTIIDGEIVPIGNVNLPLFTDVSPFDGLSYQPLIGVENKLTKQFVRLLQADCSYKIDGSFIDIPNDSSAMSTVLAAAPAPDAPEAPPVNGDPEIDPNRSVVAHPIDMISPDLFAFLNNNRAYLPQLPFRMVATCSVTGVTQGGDVITTNGLPFAVQFYEAAECCTGAGLIPGFQVGTGTGGDFVTVTE